ncbi:MAG: hypothetical protein EBR82_82580 [Caulobacteraceae bacterium]|nr:hypothetical protein [Caulobacteraceae bacterium]NDG30790.1 hypothetical protein [bacterium]
MQFSTQSSSKPRLQNDTLGDQAIIQLNDAYASLDLTAFKLFAKEIVMAGGGKQPRKQEICKAIDMTNSKTGVYKKACDFVLAGMGLGV